MAEVLIMLAAILVGGTGLVIWLNAREARAERDQLERFQRSMRASGRENLPPYKRED